MTSELKKGLLWAKPSVVAALIVKAIERKIAEVYVPAFWSLVMIMIKIIPSNFFKRISL